MLIVSGLHLDRAWPDLVPAFGRALRARSRTLLIEMVERAQELEADTILVVGDLVDRATVLPDTLDFATQTLGSFPGSVLVAPGPRDRVGDRGPYERATFAPNTETWCSESYAELATSPGLFGSAWTSARSDRDPQRQQRSAGARRVWIRAESRAARPAEETTSDLLITSGSTSVVGDGVLVAPHLVREPGPRARSAVSQALLLDLKDETIDAQVVSLSAPPVEYVDLDVTPLTSTQALTQAVATVGREPTPVYLSLAGTLAPGVLLPGSGGPMPEEFVQLDLSALTYADPPSRPGDHIMIAEFLRAMAESRDDSRTRHQVTALGLRALSNEPNDPTS